LCRLGSPGLVTPRSIAIGRPTQTEMIFIWSAGPASCGSRPLVCCASALLASAALTVVDPHRD
jgi:hypothetical protein